MGLPLRPHCARVGFVEKWELCRQDIHGRDVGMGLFDSEAAAEAAATVYTSRGHHQVLRSALLVPPLLPAVQVCMWGGGRGHRGAYANLVGCSGLSMLGLLRAPFDYVWFQVYFVRRALVKKGATIAPTVIPACPTLDD